MPATPPGRFVGQRGAAAISTLGGFLVFAVLLIAAVQLAYSLYATSLVTTAAHDAARTVAGHDSSDDRCGAAVAAGARLRESLGAYARESPPSLRWRCAGGDTIVLQVQMEHPTLLPTLLSELAVWDRTVEIRVEEPR